MYKFPKALIKIFNDKFTDSQIHNILCNVHHTTLIF